MTPIELKQVQQTLENEIYSYAKSLSLSNDNIEPIPDGVYDAERYLSAPVQIMWVLKEPVDVIKEGKPYGGGWCLYTAYNNNDAWSNRTFQPIIYSTYGVFYKKKWEDLDWIRDNPKMVDVLKQIAFINVSKMPALSHTDDSSLWEKYEIWKNILLKQLNTYCPQVIIFGNTFKYFKKDFIDIKRIGGEQGVIDIYKNDKNVVLLDVYHPNQRIITRDVYINSIINACQNII